MSDEPGGIISDASRFYTYVARSRFEIGERFTKMSLVWRIVRQENRQRFDVPNELHLLQHDERIRWPVVRCVHGVYRRILLLSYPVSYGYSNLQRLKKKIDVYDTEKCSEKNTRKYLVFILYAWQAEVLPKRVVSNRAGPVLVLKKKITLYRQFLLKKMVQKRI